MTKQPKVLATFATAEQVAFENLNRMQEQNRIPAPQERRPISTAERLRAFYNKKHSQAFYFL